MFDSPLPGFQHRFRVTQFHDDPLRLGLRRLDVIPEEEIGLHTAWIRISKAGHGHQKTPGLSTSRCPARL
jgi:hypothetical protein